MNKVLETVLKNTKPLNKSQIEAAEQMLNRALNDKKNSIRGAYSDKVEKKYAPIYKKLVDEFNKKFEKVSLDMKKEFTKEIYTRLSSENTWSGERVSYIGFSINAAHLEENHPILKIQDEVNDIVLGMKLGENLKEEMLAVVNKINSIK